MSAPIAHALDQQAPGEARTLKLISLAMAGGILFFGGVAFLAFPPPETPGNPSVLVPLTVMVLLMSVVLWPLSFVLPDRLIRSTNHQDPSASVANALAVVRARHLMALAMREAVALFGLVACIIATTGGLLATHPWVVLDALPALAFVLHTLATLPTPARIRDGVAAVVALE